MSAVNIRKGGTLTVLRDCLRFLSSQPGYEVTALVHDKGLCNFHGVRYVEIPWSTKSWLHRLWCEYVTMYGISKRMEPVDLWFSLHDTTPRVKASRQAVYCHTSFPFLRTRPQDWRMDAKIPLFAFLTRYAYQWNVKRNSYLVVQADWMRTSLASLVSFPSEKIIVSPPAFALPSVPDAIQPSGLPEFLFPSTPDCHKNFETLCRAAVLLEKRVGRGKFKLLLTIRGTENRYARWLRARFEKCESVEFHGFMSREELFSAYASSTCMVFPSRVETWGLPISEYIPCGKPMIIADLPYAHESAAGASKVAFFPAESPGVLSELMEDVLHGRLEGFAPVFSSSCRPPRAESWEKLFDLLLSEKFLPCAEE